MGGGGDGHTKISKTISFPKKMTMSPEGLVNEL